MKIYIDSSPQLTSLKKQPRGTDKTITPIEAENY